MKILKLIFIFFVFILTFSSCSYLSPEETQLNSYSQSWVSENNNEPLQNQENVIIYNHQPEEFGFVLYEYPKTSIASTDIKDFLVSFSANFILTNDGCVYSWGLNEDGALGLGLPCDALVITPVKINIDEPIEKILVSPGGNTIIALSVAKNIYCWGCNSMSQFPEIDKVFLSSPQKLDLKLNIEHVSISNTHLSISDYAGNIYECGYTNDRDGFYNSVIKNGSLPIVNSLQEPVAKIDNICEISTSFSCSAFLTTEGKVYILGAIASEKFEYYEEPKHIDFPEKILKIRAISDGIIALSDSGTLYFIGKDYYGMEDRRINTCDETYYSTELNTWYEPVQITKLSQKVEDFATSSSSILVKTENGNFYTWGYNLGHVDAESNDNTIFNPTHLDLPNNTKNFFIGSFSGTAITESYETFAWGSGYYGLYMKDTYKKSYTPTKLIFE